jgi:MoxR-like ATPase
MVKKAVVLKSKAGDSEKKEQAFSEVSQMSKQAQTKIQPALVKQNNSIQEVRAALQTKFFERGELVDGMLTAILAREMLFMLGTPGTAKSAICDALCQSIGGNYFTWLMTKFTTPEELFGPVSLKALENDSFERVTTGKLPQAEIAFLDEVFKGSSAILNTLLPVINERLFHNGSKAQRVPLQVLFGASNEIPQDPSLEALYDRFALRYVTDRLALDTSAASLFQMAAGNGPKVTIPKLSLKDLETAQAEAEQVSVPEAAIELFVTLRKAMAEAGIKVSDRKWVQAVRIVKAFAYLNGSNVVTEDHFDILKNVLWHLPEQRKQVALIINKHTNPLGEQITKLLDAVDDIVTQLEAGKTSEVEAQKKIKQAQDKAAKLCSEHPSNTKAAEAHQKIKAVNAEVCAKHLGI